MITAQLRSAVASGNIEGVKYLVEKGADIRGALPHAAASGNIEVVKYLVEKG